MKKLLTVGMEELVLPAGANINALLETLSGATFVRSAWRGDLGHHVYVPDVEARRTQVSVQIINDNQLLTRRQAMDLAESDAIKAAHPLAIQKLGGPGSAPASEGGAL